MKKEYPDFKAAYPIKITYDDSEKDTPYLVYIPDFKSNTSGKTFVDAIEMARNAISEEGLARQDMKLSLPEPSKNLPTKKDEIVTYVDIDLGKFRRRTEARTVKKTLTIPSYLNELGRDHDINFSEVLTEALRNKLGV